MLKKEKLGNPEDIQGETEETQKISQELKKAAEDMEATSASGNETPVEDEKASGKPEKEKGRKEKFDYQAEMAKIIERYNQRMEEIDKIIEEVFSYEKVPIGDIVYANYPRWAYGLILAGAEAKLTEQKRQGDPAEEVQFNKLETIAMSLRDREWVAEKEKQDAIDRLKEKEKDAVLEGLEKA